MDPNAVNAQTASPTTTKLVAAKRAGRRERERLEDEVLRSYLPMARRLANRYAGHGADLDDLAQVANLALLKAIRGFQADRGAFESYAKATISGELKRHLRDHCWSIRPPRRVQELQSQIRQATEAFAHEGGALPGTLELAGAMQASVSDISEALSARSCYVPTSLDRPVGVTGRPLAENIADEEQPYERVDTWVALGQICSDLSDEDITLIRLRFYECLSQRQIAEEIGISQMQVSRRLARLLASLREKALEPAVA